MIDLYSSTDQRFLYSVAWGMLAGALIVFVLCRTQQAPYGRYSTSASPWWGPNIPAKWAWFVQELPSFLWAFYAMIFVPSQTIVAKILIGCFLVHYFQRTFVFSTLIRGGKPTKLVPFVMAFCFCFINGYLQTTYLTKYFIFDHSVMSYVWLILGLLLFVSGMLINIHSDTILRNLRRTSLEQTHKIPHGGFFKYVSAANFFGEIVEWTGFAFAQQCALPALAFAAFTFANIGPRGQQHHQDYLKRFVDYPKKRKAVIPFLW